MILDTKQSTWLFRIIILACLLPFVSPTVALAIGVIVAFIGLKPVGIHSHTAKILQVSIVLLGFGMNLNEVIEASKEGFVLTMISVSVVMLLGIVLGKLFKVEKNITLLIAAGTAICGGSAIAAVSPILKSKDYQSSFALIVVFVLNALALVIFPYIGHRFQLSQEVFGNWAAVAIHDTSSVVGAGAIYGEKALQIATTVKLIRALWIIPLSIVIMVLNKTEKRGSIKLPWFILFFVLAIGFANVFPNLQQVYFKFNWLGKRGMVIALFLIGSSMTIKQIKKSGIKSFVLGISLWLITAIGSFFLLRL